MAIPTGQSAPRKTASGAGASDASQATIMRVVGRPGFCGWVIPCPVGVSRPNNSGLSSRPCSTPDPSSRHGNAQAFHALWIRPTGFIADCNGARRFCGLTSAPGGRHREERRGCPSSMCSRTWKRNSAFFHPSRPIRSPFRRISWLWPSTHPAFPKYHSAFRPAKPAG